MKNPLKSRLFILIAFLVGLQTASRGAIAHADSNWVVQKNWNRVNYQMHHFCQAVKAYVRVVTRIRPGDSGIARDAELYSDSVNHALRKTGPGDTAAIKTVESLFDTLVVVSLRLVNRVESDTALMNSRAVKNLTRSMQSIRSNINQAQQNFTESAARRKEKKEETKTDSTKS